MPTISLSLSWLRVALICGAAIAAMPQIAQGQIAKAEPIVTEGTSLPESWKANDGFFGIKRRFEKPRSAFWIPLTSFLLPGFDQYWEGQWYGAVGYTATAVAGYRYAASISNANFSKSTSESGEDDPQKDRNADFDSKSIAGRKVMVGNQVAQWAGGMSTYHAFRTAVRTRKTNLGEYAFLNFEETPWDLMVAPARFDYLIRPTTFIPLAVIAALSSYSARQPAVDGYRVVKDVLRPEDYAFAGAFSYNAGTHEEAFFRGWIQPLLMEQWGSPWWSNFTQALIFSSAHLNTNPFPIIQFGLGLHFGFVTQRNGYRISEVVFIHTWWNVVAFLASYSTWQVPANTSQAVRGPVLWLPPLQYTF